MKAGNVIIFWLSILALICVIMLSSLSIAEKKEWWPYNKPDIALTTFDDISTSQNRTIAQLIEIQDMLKKTKTHLEQAIPKRVAILMIQQLKQNPEASIGKFYRGSIIFVHGYNLHPDRPRVEHGEIIIEEGTPSSEGMQWEILK